MWMGEVNRSTMTNNAPNQWNYLFLGIFIGNVCVIIIFAIDIQVTGYRVPGARQRIYVQRARAPKAHNHRKTAVRYGNHTPKYDTGIT